MPDLANFSGLLSVCFGICAAYPFVTREYAEYTDFRRTIWGFIKWCKAELGWAFFFDLNVAAVLFSFSKQVAICSLAICIRFITKIFAGIGAISCFYSLFLIGLLTHHEMPPSEFYIFLGLNVVPAISCVVVGFATKLVISDSAEHLRKMKAEIDAGIELARETLQVPELEETRNP